MATALKTKLGVSETAKFAIGFFFLSEFKEIQDQLDGLKEVKLLIGSTTTFLKSGNNSLDHAWHYEKLTKCKSGFMRRGMCSGG